MSKSGRIQLTLGVQPPVGGSDLVAHMAFLRGWALENYVTRDGREGHLFLVMLTVPDEWGPEDREVFEGEITRALHLMRGMPWLGVREVLAYMAAEVAVERVEDEEASELFALLRSTDKRGWGEVVTPLLRRLKPYGEEAGKQVAATAATAALTALLRLVISLA